MARKKTAAQLDREVAQALAKAAKPTKARSRGKALTDSGGYKVDVSGSGSWFSASYAAPFHIQGVVGHGNTVEAAVADLEKAMTAYHRRRERDEWSEHEEEKERRLRDDDY